MVQDDTQLLLKEIDYLKKRLSEVKSPLGEMRGDYIRQQKLYGDTPHDEFAQRHRLLFHPTAIPKNQTELLPPDALLGSIKDSKTLLLYQNDLSILHRFYDMGLRSDGVMDLFDSLYYPWYQNMRLTAALGGTERWLQAGLEPLSTPYESFSFWQKRQAKKEEKRRGGGIRGFLRPKQEESSPYE